MPLTLPFQSASRMGMNQAAATPNHRAASTVRRTPPARAATTTPVTTHASWRTNHAHRRRRETERGRGHQHLGERRWIPIAVESLGRHRTGEHLRRVWAARGRQPLGGDEVVGEVDAELAFGQAASPLAPPGTSTR